MQYNINVANGTGLDVRTNLNLAHQSLATNFFGATDPSTMSPVCAFPGSTWLDTGNNQIKVRNANDSDWIVIGTIEADGTPKLGGNAINTSEIIPVGAIILYAVNGSLPEDFLKCDGGAVSRTLYAKLFGKIGTTYGSGDGSRTFNLPNYTGGTFPEGASTAGMAHAAGLPNITGASSRPVLFNNSSGVSGAFAQIAGTGTGVEIAGAIQRDNVGNIQINASRSSSIYGASTTVQPKSLTTRFIIKYQ